MIAQDSQLQRANHTYASSEPENRVRIILLYVSNYYITSLTINLRSTIVDILLIFEAVFRYEAVCCGQFIGYRCVGNFVENRKERSPQTPAREAAAQPRNRELACNEFPIPGSRFPKNYVCFFAVQPRW